MLPNPFPSPNKPPDGAKKLGLLKMSLVIWINFPVSRTKPATDCATLSILLTKSSIDDELDAVTKASTRPLPIVSLALLPATVNLASEPA